MNNGYKNVSIQFNIPRGGGSEKFEACVFTISERTFGYSPHCCLSRLDQMDTLKIKEAWPFTAQVSYQLNFLVLLWLRIFCLVAWYSGKTSLYYYWLCDSNEQTALCHYKLVSYGGITTFPWTITTWWQWQAAASHLAPKLGGLAMDAASDTTELQLLLYIYICSIQRNTYNTGHSQTSATQPRVFSTSITKRNCRLQGRLRKTKQHD